MLPVRLGAFANVCRHRGSEVVLECAGNRKTLQCHYHGWTYNLDGTLRTAPRENEQPSFAKEDALARAVRGRDLGAADFRQPIAGRASVARRDRRIAGDLRARGNRFRANADAAAGRLRNCRELENRRREFQRMLPLPDRASEVFRSDRHQRLPRRDRSRIFLDLLRPDRRIARQRRQLRDAMAQRFVLALRAIRRIMQAISVVPIDAGHSPANR